MNKPLYYVLAYYHFTPISNPLTLVDEHKDFFHNRDIASRIYISEEGINGQMSGLKSDVEAYMTWMHAKAEFSKMPFKIHAWHENVFPRKTVKFRKQLVALDEKVNLDETGKHLTPKEWKEKLASKNRPLLLDVRNEYEWEVGRFEGAECPPCQTFREFRNYAQTLKKVVNPESTPVMMYCTGGIRCEPYSAYLRQQGFTEIYQLEGGIINYGLQEGNDHWLGKLFVFDDRLTVPINEDPSPAIGKCHHCRSQIEAYYNCSNMDCNHLFLCCPSCLKEYSGCCSKKCLEAPRLRPYQDQNPHKPFRKKIHYQQSMSNPNN